jgi:hypothetical protein
MNNGFSVPNSCIGYELLEVDELAIYTLTIPAYAISARIFIDPVGTTGTPELSALWDPATGTDPDATRGAKFTDTESYITLWSLRDLQQFRITGIVGGMTARNVQVFYYNNSSNVA